MCASWSASGIVVHGFVTEFTSEMHDGAYFAFMLFRSYIADSADIRRRIRTRFQTRSTEAFELLSAIGRDCVGAVQLLPPDQTPEGWNRGTAEPLTDAGVEATLRAVTAAAPRKRPLCFGCQGDGFDPPERLPRPTSRRRPRPSTESKRGFRQVSRSGSTRESVRVSRVNRGASQTLPPSHREARGLPSPADGLAVQRERSAPRMRPLIAAISPGRSRGACRRLRARQSPAGRHRSRRCTRPAQR